ncbi:hypothetical protein M378DRAFT_162970, partial [Amanita muscaria Koide BX008]
RVLSFLQEIRIKRASVSGPFGLSRELRATPLTSARVAPCDEATRARSIKTTVDVPPRHLSPDPPFVKTLVGYFSI